MSKSILVFIKSIFDRSNIYLNRTEIIEHLYTQGGLTTEAVFMTIISCAVATAGLLQSSPAVVIGAMLISPLMSPIIAFGIALCMLDLKLILRSLQSISIGVILSIIVSYLLVKLCPLDDTTAEILALTKPNILDLIIAIFSALVGVYAVIMRKGETILGVAMATALMPPLAVVGYGLAMGKLVIAEGSFFLFLTNLIAISLSTTLMGVWYGFGYKRNKEYTKWQVALILTIFIILAIPLAHSLKNIANKVKIEKTTRSIITDYFTANDNEAKMVLFKVNITKDNVIQVDSVVLTKKYNLKARSQILSKLEIVFKQKIMLSLEQLLIEHHSELTDKLADN